MIKFELFAEKSTGLLNKKPRFHEEKT